MTTLLHNNRIILAKTTRVMLARTSKANFQFHATNEAENPIKQPEDIKIPNKLGGIWEHPKLPRELIQDEFNYPICRDQLGIRYPGYWFQRKFVYVPEMEPELIVPDLTGFELKPYVSYRCEDVNTKPFTAKDLFDQVYAEKVEKSYLETGVEEMDVPAESIDEARLRALQTGADLFESFTYDGVSANLEHTVALND